jgi:putative membrane-bound dehydrogenase-like protein
MKSPAGYATVAAWIVAVVLSALVISHARGQLPPADMGLTVPAGFEVERVAGPPLVNRPIVADFDEEGRLYVADSSGSNDKVEQQLAEKPHRIVRLEDGDGDGRFDRRVVFADRMMFPEGAMWFDGSLYVAAPPSIWKLTDTNGDGVADRREEWFQGKTLTGCANDLHGPYLGPDGWIYWTKGAFAEQVYERPGRSPLVTKAAHIFRRHPSRSEIESVMTGGMDNPVDVAFTAAGERILTSTFVEHPQLGRRDGLIHAIYGGLYGKPHAVIDGHTRTGDLMPVLLELGPAVPSGLTRYASTAFGSEYRDNFFAAMFNLRKVSRVTLEPDGATFKATETAFLESSNRDFHPTDVIEDADGSLLVVDTGPWYKLCCPTSQLAKPDVPGAIYRVRRSGAHGTSDSRGLRLGWSGMKPADLAALLGDDRPAVRTRAIHQLGRIGPGAVPVLREAAGAAASVEARRNAVWALTHIDSPEAREAVRAAHDDRDASVRQVAVHSAGIWRDARARPQLVDALRSGAPALQRAAAEALGRAGDPRAVSDLIGAAALQTDRALEHSLTYALIELGDPDRTAAAGFAASSSRAKRASLIAIDQMDRGGLKPDAIVPLLDSADPLLKDAAWWIAGRHSDWGGALAAFFEKRLTSPPSGVAERDDLQQGLSRFGDNPAIQGLLAATVERAGSRDARVTALAAMASAGTASTTRFKELPAVWIAPIVRALASDDVEIVRRALAVARAAPASKAQTGALNSALLQVARNARRPREVRLDAMAAIRDGVTVVDPVLFDLLRTSLGVDLPLPVRTSAAAVLEKARLDRSQLQALTRSLPTLGPLELPRVLRAFDHGNDETLGFAMLSGLERLKSKSSLRADILRPRLAKYPASVQKRGEALLASLDARSTTQAQRLEALLQGLATGDVRRGQEVFNGPKAACASCHAIGYLGGTLGPDLTRIGEVRTERDLLEAIVFPSASFARAYEPVVVTTTSGAVHSGVLRRDLQDEVVVAVNDREEIRIPRRQVADMQPGVVSLMPQGLDDQLTRQELADLLAFLKATRWGAN